MGYPQLSNRFADRKPPKLTKEEIDLYYYDMIGMGLTHEQAAAEKNRLYFKNGIETDGPMAQ